jgi:hypothetical protein
MLSNLSALAGPFEVITNLELKEPSGVARANWPVTTGVPLPEGTLKEAGDAVLLDADGKPVPVQFEVLSRWNPGDGSIRWLLVDTQATLSPRELATFSLAKGVGSSDATLLRADESDDAVTITTGPLRFRIDRNEGFRPFSAAWLDVSGDGRFDGSEQILQPTADDGASIQEASSGRWHRSSNALPKSVSLEIRGPLRVVVRVDGAHVATGGGSNGECHDYTCRIHAYAGKPFVKIQYTVKNLRFEFPLRAWAITDGSLTSTLNVSGKRMFSFGHREDSATGELVAGVTAALSQVDPGSYHISVGGKELCFGETAPGWADLSDDRWGLTAGVLDFALQYPKAIEIKDDRLAVRLLSPRVRKTSFIEIGCTKTHDLVYHFHAGPVDAKEVTDLVTAVREPAHLLPPTGWVSKSKAWPMDLCVPDQPRSYQQGNARPYDVARFGGWDRFGGYWERGGLNAGGYHSNMDTVMGRYVQTGDYSVFRRWAPRGRAMVEYTPWSPEGFHFKPGTVAHTKKANGGFPLIPVNTLTGQTAFTPEEYELYRYFVACDRHWPHYKTEDHVQFCEGYVERRFGRPDSGHFGIFPVTETYLLTGDPVLREGLQRMLEVMKFQISHRQGHCPAASYGARYQGWYQLGLAQIYACTGDETILPYLDMTGPPTLERLRQRPRGWYGNSGGEKLFMVSGLIGGLYNNWLLTGNEDARDSIIALCDWAVHFGEYIPKDQGGTGFPYFWEPDNPTAWHGKGQLHPRRLIPFAYGYRVTGRQDIFDLGEDLASFDHNPYHGSYQSWYTLTQQPRSDTIPPAAVRDLAVKPLEDGAVEVSFTAPGDDGTNGSAAEYQVKWSMMPLVEVVKWPQQQDTHRAFWWGQNVPDEPGAVPAGQKVCLRLEGLPAGRLYFAVKSYDDESNISDLSNVAEVTIRETEP